MFTPEMYELITRREHCLNFKKRVSGQVHEIYTSWNINQIRC